MSPSQELVSVIIPAFNAAATLGDTLASVQAQTHSHLEIIVVDDGSTDGTLSVAGNFAANDPRIRVLTQDNAGTALARNRGVKEARGRFIAPVDADDLWRPQKIERQLEKFERAGSQIGLVYTWFAGIDEGGRITSLEHCPTAEGDVRRDMCRGHLVGNGSSALIRRDVFFEVGGYDPAYPNFCEDLRLYFLIAERYHFGLVREHLTGYRQRPDSMSNNVLEMLNAFDAVMDEFRPKYTQFKSEFREGRKEMVAWLFRKAVKTARWREARFLFSILLNSDARLASEVLVRVRATRMQGRAFQPGSALSSVARGVARLKFRRSSSELNRPFLPVRAPATIQGKPAILPVIFC